MAFLTDHWDPASTGGELASLPQLALQLLRACTSDLVPDSSPLSSQPSQLRLACQVNPVAMATLGRSGRRTDMEGLVAAVLPLVTQQGTVSWTESRYQDSLLTWWRSQRAAHIARALALVSGQAAADDFFAAALLVGVGYEHHTQYFADILLPKLRSSESVESYTAYCQSQPVADAGAGVQALLAQHGWPMAVRDAVRYHAAPITQLADARPLLQIVNLGWRLGWQLSVEPANLKQCARLLGLQESLLGELVQQADHDVGQLAQQLGLPVWDQATLAHCQDAQHELSRSLQWLLKFEGWQQQLRNVANVLQMEQCLQEILQQIARPYASVLWIAEADAGQVASSTLQPTRLRPFQELDDAIAADLVLAPSRSLIASAALGQQIVVLNEAEQQQRAISIVDRQVFARISAPNIVMIPVRTGEIVSGVLLCGAGPMRSDSQFVETAAIARLVFTGITRYRELLRTNPLVLDARALQEWVHEVSNPLTIVGNYVATMLAQHAQDTALCEDLGRIRQELARTAALINDPQGVTARRHASNNGCDVNVVVQDVVRLLSTGAATAIRFDIRLAASHRTIVAADTVQQIVTNILKNAVEVLDASGEVSVVSDDNMQWDGERYVLLVISDNGTGLPPPLRDHAFAGGVSTKAGHAGLGLHITKRLVDDAGGRILCRTSDRGTQFQLLLPQRDSTS
jgi:signal transduction histidine kinase